MDKLEKENAKMANQAWRKKPRKFAPKSKLGCKTCKIRRIKCDLAQPSCLKCKSTGRTCDGYNEWLLGSSHHHSDNTNIPENCGSQFCTSVTQFRGLGTLMTIPVTDPTQSDAMLFFEYISIKHLDEHNPCEHWRKTLMFFSHTIPSVHHAATALALIHRNYYDGNSGNRVDQSHAALMHYNRAIQLLLNQKTANNAELTAVTLLVCYLFTCFDQLAGNYVQATNHLRGGVELVRNIDKNGNNAPDDFKHSDFHTLIDQVTKRIHRLDMQAATFLLDWTPVVIDETPLSQNLPLPVNVFHFRSLNDAVDHLQILVARVMRLRNTMSLPPTSSPSAQKDIVLGQLETWSRVFENMLQHGQDGSSLATYSNSTFPRISLLRLQHAISWIYLSSYGPGGEMEYDNFLPKFQQCVALANDVAAAHERYSESLKPTFTPEIGLVPVLYIIGVKCRHPMVRREVLSILRRQSIWEAVWDSISAARVVERVIEIEECGSGDGNAVCSMGQIPVWQRIEDLSWVHHSPGQSCKVDITYTFCTQEGTYTESLLYSI